MRAILPAFHLSEIATIGAPPDIVLLAVKSNATADTVKQLLPYLTDQSVVVSLQNCINEEVIASIVGARRTIGAMVIGFGGELIRPGRAQSSQSNRRVVVGELDGSLTPRLQSLANALESTVHPEMTDNIWGILWTKMVLNSEMNAVAAITGLRTDEIAADPLARRVSLSLAREVVSVALALGVKLNAAELDGPPEDYLQQSDSESMREIERRYIERWSRISVKPSMLQDMEKRRPTEVAFMNGYVVEKARTMQLQAPVNEAIVRVVMAAEDEHRGPDPAAFSQAFAELRKA